MAHWKYQAPRLGKDKDTGAPLFYETVKGKRTSVLCPPDRGWTHETAKDGSVMSAFNADGNVRLNRVVYAPSITFEGAFWKTNITPALAWHICKVAGVTYDKDGAVTGLGNLTALGDFGEACAILSTMRNVRDEEDDTGSKGGLAEMKASLPGKVRLVKASEATATGTVRRGA